MLAAVASFRFASSLKSGLMVDFSPTTTNANQPPPRRQPFSNYGTGCERGSNMRAVLFIFHAAALRKPKKEGVRGKKKKLRLGE